MNSYIKMSFAIGGHCVIVQLRYHIVLGDFESALHSWQRIYLEKVLPIAIHLADTKLFINSGISLIIYFIIATLYRMG